VRAILFAVVFATTAATMARAADDPVLANATDLAGFVTFAESGAPGMILVVVRGNATLVHGYGETEKGNKHAPDGNSLLRLNSITKVFTTEVVVSLAADRKLALTDPLQRFTDKTVPLFGKKPITLLDLATHSAGLPREMPGEPEGSNSRAWPTHEDRWGWLPGYTLPWAPGTVASYSNIGFDLLADATEAAGGQPYSDLLSTRVTAPLGMTDTSFTPTPEQCTRLMIGSGLGGPIACSDTRATDGSGGLYSTGNDISRWLRHNLDDVDGALALSHAVYRPRQSMPAAIGFDEAGPMAGLSLGWVMLAAHNAQPILLTKSGGGAGFMAYMAFAPGQGVGVFIAASRVDFPMFAILTDTANKLIASLVTR
jgi:D-alanyl-D-alanine-carboxypeptidase/D-alanyl-D-alanine-endopeptidase